MNFVKSISSLVIYFHISFKQFNTCITLFRQRAFQFKHYRPPVDLYRNQFRLILHNLTKRSFEFVTSVIFSRYSTYKHISIGTAFKLCAFMVCEQLEAIFFIIISQSWTRYVTFSAKSSKYWAFHITAYVEIFAYVYVYCLCIGPCFYDILFVVFKILSSSFRLEAVYIIRHSISPIYCYHSDRDIFKLSQNIYDWRYVYTILNQTFSEMHESTILKQISL